MCVYVYVYVYICACVCVGEAFVGGVYLMYIAKGLTDDVDVCLMYIVKDVLLMM